MRTFALNYLKEAALKDGNSHITIECVEILGTDNEQVQTFAQNYLKEPALKDKNGFVTKKCIELLGTKGNIVKGIVKHITNYGVFTRYRWHSWTVPLTKSSAANFFSIPSHGL